MENNLLQDDSQEKRQGDKIADGSTLNVASFSSRNRVLLIAAGLFAFVVVLALVFWPRGESVGKENGDKVAQAEHGDEHGDEQGEVELTPEALAAAGIEIGEAAKRPAAGTLNVTGTVEANQQQMQQVSALVSGRVERVNVALGDRVRAGQTLAVIASPQVAELHGKLHEAETRLELAERNFQRVERAENRVGVLTAQAKLNEAEANLKRTRRLMELGAGAGKDLVAAETAFKTAKAEYEFESNISLNREVQVAKAEVETARVEVFHIRNGLRALGADVSEGEDGNVRHDISIVALTAPISGSVIERTINAGAGIEPGKTLFTVANISTVWVIANVPESQIGLLQMGAPAEMRSAVLGEKAVSGRVAYIDPVLNEETRTARVRIEAANPEGRLKVGMFVEVGFQSSSADGGVGEDELAVPEGAVQRVGERSIVFIPKEEAGRFEAREVQAGGLIDGYHRILGGLEAGERVVTKGSFTLKTQMMKGELGEHGH